MKSCLQNFASVALHRLEQALVFFIGQVLVEVPGGENDRLFFNVVGVVNGGGSIVAIANILRNKIYQTFVTIPDSSMSLG